MVERSGEVYGGKELRGLWWKGDKGSMVESSSEVYGGKELKGLW